MLAVGGRAIASCSARSSLTSSAVTMPAGDVVLDGEDVVHGPIVALRPDLAARNALDQAGGDPHAVAGAAHAAFEDMADAQPGAGLGRVANALIDAESRLPCGHEQTGDLRQLGDQVLRDAVAEIVLGGVPGQVGEGQHRHRRLVGCAPRGRHRRLPMDRYASVLDAMRANRPGDVLQRQRPDILEHDRQLVADMLAHRLRHQHAAGLAKLLQPCGDVHPVAQDEFAVGHHVAEIDADPVLEAPLGRHRLLLGGHHFLQLDRAQDGVDHGAELDQEAVADDLHQPPVMGGDQRLDHLAAQLLQRGDGAGLVLLDQPRVADHICGHDRRQPALDLRRLQRRSPTHRAATQRRRRRSPRPIMPHERAQRHPAGGIRTSVPCGSPRQRFAPLRPSTE